MKRVAVACLSLLFLCGSECRAQSVHIRVLSRFHPKQFEVRPEGNIPVLAVIAGKSFFLQPGASDSTVGIAADGNALKTVIHGGELPAADLRLSYPSSYAPFGLAVPGGMSRHYRGMLVVTAHDGELVAEVTMDLEDATASAVDAEAEPGTPLEALKAQAIVTRSYYFAAKGRHANDEFCDLTHCQVLRGLPAENSAASRATRETEGLVLEYQEKPFAPMFTRSCGGRTRTPAEVGMPANGYPYYSVVCDYCHTTPYRWSRKLSAADAATVAKGESGRLAVDRRLGWNAVPSNTSRARPEGNEVILEGTGQGHGIGLCQRGARAMAELGASYREILQHYFPNTRLEFYRYPNP